MSESKSTESAPAKRSAAKVSIADLGDNPVEIELTQHWTHPDTGENVLPGTLVTVNSDLGQSLIHGGYAKGTDKK